MSMYTRSLVRLDDPTTQAYGEPSRFGGLSEYGQPGCLIDSQSTIADPSPLPELCVLNWQLMLGDARHEWSRITRKDLEWANGDPHDLAGLIQLSYPVTSTVANQEVKHFLDAHGITAAADTLFITSIT